MQLLHLSKGPDSFVVSLHKLGAGCYQVSVGGSDFAARFVLEKVGRRWSLWNRHQHEVLSTETAMSMVDALMHSGFEQLNGYNTQGAN